jgi:hypothetical protein
VLFGDQIFRSYGAWKLLSVIWSIDIWSRWDRRLPRTKNMNCFVTELRVRSRKDAVCERRSVVHSQDSSLKYFVIDSLGQLRVARLQRRVLCKRRLLIPHAKIRSSQIHPNLAVART